ncbi:copper-binding protein [Yersinia enterocolitica]|uniref:copper-binding protein n=1 Tax=Yersinia enterocolitica TaxID=630 RepID=UPI00094B9717|nr:copper-binding protein [Yersinia enterocolitica]HDM8439972.1 copper-binding protein [Yersinia enterocolitica]HEI6849767.1 copper-binding protein [Yersinia enterocolitica]HEN3614934.1 copper-binding protein [Yersinia enterocolitica]HEN3639017.1 copper-binding protein [Yersinia enterocolitica]
MSTLFNAVSATATTLVYAVVVFSAPLLAATPSMTESMPMSHNHGVMMADTTTTNINDYHSRGQIKAWNANSVSIAHSAIPALNWPPMTMSFDLPNNLAATSIPVGTQVTFSFRQTEQGYQLTAISAQQQ